MQKCHRWKGRKQVGQGESTGINCLRFALPFSLINEGGTRNRRISVKSFLIGHDFPADPE